MSSSPFIFSLFIVYTLESVSALISLEFLFWLFFSFISRVCVIASMINLFLILTCFVFDLIIFKLVKSIQISLKTIRAIAIAISHVRKRCVKQNFASAIHTGVTTYCRALYFGISFAYSFHFLYILQLTFINDFFIHEEVKI